LSDEQSLNGYLDHLRENLEILDEQIENAREMSKSKDKGANALQWVKVLRDLIDLRNVTLDKIKAHLLGRDETGTVEEPMETYSSDNHPLTLFERKVHDFLADPWTVADLKIECEKCGKDEETTKTRTFGRFYVDKDWRNYIEPPDQDLCSVCYEKVQEEIQTQVSEAKAQAEKKPLGP
jgi:hypothetical protein